MVKQSQAKSIGNKIASRLHYEKNINFVDTIAKKSLPTVTLSNTLDGLQKQVATCTLCFLCKSRTNTVFGSGNTKTKLLFVGEGPGADEDKQGLPFVGRSGQLLTKIIQAMKLERDQIYIANIVKCRPPENRPPEPKEIEQCLPYLQKQIELIAPKIICTLGKTATDTLLKLETPVSNLRGKFYLYQNILVLPTYHPAYLLRSPDKKKDVWEDMQLIMKKLEAM